MKLAWLCYGWGDDIGYPSATQPVILFVEPTGYGNGTKLRWKQVLGVFKGQTHFCHTTS